MGGQGILLFCSLGGKFGGGVDDERGFDSNLVPFRLSRVRPEDSLPAFLSGDVLIAQTITTKRYIHMNYSGNSLAEYRLRKGIKPAIKVNWAAILWTGLIVAAILYGTFAPQITNAKQLHCARIDGAFTCL